MVVLRVWVTEWWMQTGYLVWQSTQLQGSTYVVGREGWKSMVVNRLIYGCGALVWYQHECNDLEWYGTVALGCWKC